MDLTNNLLSSEGLGYLSIYLNSLPSLPQLPLCIKAGSLQFALRETMSDCLPSGVIFEILLRLPVKSVIRFRCVSKTWCSLISSPHFIATHLNRSLSNPQHPPYILLRHVDYRNTARLTLHSSKEPFSCNNFIELRSSDQNIDRFKFVAGSSNGLLCLANDGFVSGGGSYLLWNPSIQKAIALPDPRAGISFHGPFVHALGFGYEPKADDYKLVRVGYREGPYDTVYDGTPDWVQIYTLRTGEWRTVMAPGPPYHFEMFFPSAFLNGAVHWPAHVPQHEGAWRNVIVSFHMEDETFREVDMPKSLQGVRYLNGVAVVDGLLALVPYNNMPEESYSVWVMQEYGCVESWTKLFDFENLSILSEVIGLGNNGEVLLTKDGWLFSYDPSSQQTEGLLFRGQAGSFFLDKYVESLVLLNLEEVPAQQGNPLAV